MCSQIWDALTAAPPWAPKRTRHPIPLRVTILSRLVKTLLAAPHVYRLASVIWNVRVALVVVVKTAQTSLLWPLLPCPRRLLPLKTFVWNWLFHGLRAFSTMQIRAKGPIAPLWKTRTRRFVMTSPRSVRASRAVPHVPMRGGLLELAIPISSSVTLTVVPFHLLPLLSSTLPCLLLSISPPAS